MTCTNKAPRNDLRNGVIFTAAALVALFGMGCAESSNVEGENNPACMVAATALISDFEDGGNGVAQVEGRNGGWYVYNDGTGTQAPVPGALVSASRGGACGGYALTTSGSGFTIWGAGLGTDLASVAMTKTKYDVSKYQGVSFMVKSNKTAIEARFKVQTAGTVPTTDGGSCTTGDMCNNAHGKLISITPEWQQIKAPWSEITQEAWGTIVPFNAQEVLGIQIQVAVGISFDFSIDQVAFY